MNLPRQASAQVFDWAGHFDAIDETSYHVTINDMVVDDAGNVFTTGAIHGSVDMDPGTGVANYFSAGGDDPFVCKLNTGGGLEWAVSFGNLYNCSAEGIALDADGSIYVTGYFADQVDFDPGIETNTLTATGNNNDIFLLKLNADGSFAWAQRYGSSNDDRGAAVAVDDDGNILLTGSFIGTVDFQNGTGTTYLDSPTGTADAFVLRMNGAGEFVWAVSFTGDHPQLVNEVATDAAGNVFVAGYVYGTSDFGTASLVTPYDDPLGYIAKLLPTGVLAWVEAAAGEETTGLDVDATGHAVTVGYDAANSIKVVKWDTDGDALWELTPFCYPGVNGLGVALDVEGNVYVTGSNNAATMDFDPGPDTYYLDANGVYDPYIWKLDGDAAFAWAVEVTGTGYEGGRHVAVSDAGAVYCSGFFSGTVDFDPGAGEFPLTAISEEGSFVMRLNQCAPGSATEVVSACSYFTWANGDGNTYTESTDTPTWTYTTAAGCDSTLHLDLTINQPTSGADVVYTCNSYTWIDGNTYTENVSGAEYHLTDVNGCDSMVLLYLTLINVDTTLFAFEGTLFSNATGTDYQWVDCNDNNTPIPGEDESQFTPTVSGSYAVEITTAYCTMFSECMEVIVSGVDDVSAEPLMSVSPNPTTGTVQLSFTKGTSIRSISVLDAVGSLVSGPHPAQGTQVTISIAGPSGLYHLVATDGDGGTSRAVLVKAQ